MKRAIAVLPLLAAVALAGCQSSTKGSSSAPAVTVTAPAVTVTAPAVTVAASPVTVSAPPVTVTVSAPAVTVTASSSTAVVAPAPKAPVVHAPTAAPTPAAKPGTAAVTSQLTAQEQQAVLAAKDYLSLGGGFSRHGLIDQLSSSYGSGFSVAAATAAVDSLGVDWNAQAVLAAKGYLSLGTGFSHAALVSQLDSPDGSKFTAAQAEYGATKAGD
jgi:hypothetical protein